MILVTVGTHHQPFDRLVLAAEALALRGETVVVQAGTSTVPTPSCERHGLVAPERLAGWAAAAEVVITHAGPGSIFLALDAGTPLIVVPRSPHLGEHVDDHQQRFARHIGDRVAVVHDPAELPARWKALLDVVQNNGVPSEEGATAAFCEGFGRLADRVARPPGLRLRVLSLLFGRSNRP